MVRANLRPHQPRPARPKHHHRLEPPQQIKPPDGHRRKGAQVEKTRQKL